MAHYENVINNTEDIVVAISHMVVGLCSVTSLPLASTYVFQRRAAMTSSSSAHLALPAESHSLRVGADGYSSWLLAWVNFLCGIRSDWGHNVNRRLGRPIKLWCSREREGRGGGRHETRTIPACLLFIHKQNVLMHIGTISLFSVNNLKIKMFTCTWTERQQTNTRSKPIKWVELSPSPQ